MKKGGKLFRSNTIVVGVLSSLSFILFFYVFSVLRPKMVRFDVLSKGEIYLMNVVVIGLLLFFVFCLLTLYRTVIHIKNSEKMSLYSLFLVILGILSLLFVFADIALLSDIGKQYAHGLSQPEWNLLLPIMLFQFFTGIVFLYSHIGNTISIKYNNHIAQDSNIFLTVQYVGVICGFLGLVSSSLGFFYRQVWSLTIHTTPSIIILLFPYVLVVLFWIVVKIKGKSTLLFDEKQMLDIGKAALVTLPVSLLFMFVLFAANFSDLEGIISILWFPLVLFCILFSFSLGTLIFTRRA